MKVRKYFRGSGRILAFVFIASVIWLLFDMAALRVSINDVNSKFLKERFVKEREAVRHRATRRTYLVNRVGFKNQKQKVDLDLETEVIFPNKMDNRVYKQRTDANPAIKTSKLTNHKPPNLNMGVGVAKHDEKESSNVHLKAPLRPTTLHVSKNVELLKDQRIILDVHKVPVLEVERGGMDEAPREIPVGLPNLTEAPPGVQEEKMQLTQFQKDEPEELNRQVNPVLKAKENILDKGSKILDKDIFKVEIEKQHSSLKDKQENTIKPERKNTREKDKLRSPEDKPNSPQIMSGTLKNETVKQLAQTVSGQNFPPGGANGTHSMGLKKSKGMHRVLFLDVTQKPRESDAVGQFGHPVVVPKDKEQEMRDRWNEGHFNVYLSEQIPVDRAIPDTRPQTCSEILVHDDLPTTSVIFCFVDEVWSTLLRSVHSVLNRSPPNLLEEIILVDDFSTKDYLKEQLDKYMSQFPKVRILRLKERQGLIRARLAGAAIAKGEVLTFLDSHIECNVGWLEPLLERVYMDRKKVACPVIEVINDKDMSYVLVDNFQRGIFKWPLVFGWNTLSQEVIRKDKLKDSDPIRCPVMAGGLFAIDRKYFYELGTYDPGLDVWGGENMEISFKIWMCGGEIEIIPCSRVGHIFRSDNPYKFPKDRQKTVERNLARVAEVWLDEYKDLFYGHGYHHLLNKGAIDIGNLTDQIRLRAKLQCKSFRWYLENIYPDLEAPLVRAQGLIFSLGARKCVALEAGVLSFNICDLGKQSQNFNLTWLGHVQQKSLCLAPHGSNDSVVLEPCDNTKPHLRWRHKSLNSALAEHLMVEWGSYHQCLEANAQGVAIYLRKCDPTSQLQKWQFTHYFSQ